MFRHIISQIDGHLFLAVSALVRTLNSKMHLASIFGVLSTQSYTYTFYTWHRTSCAHHTTQHHTKTSLPDVIYTSHHRAPYVTQVPQGCRPSGRRSQCLQQERKTGISIRLSRPTHCQHLLLPPQGQHLRKSHKTAACFLKPKPSPFAVLYGRRLTLWLTRPPVDYHLFGNM